jgi:peptidoglycan/xylan/chitin deacetylase (PgdA/CDA1 family)
VNIAQRAWHSILGRTVGRHGGVVLVYHRVATLDRDPQLLAVTPENFASHLEVLRDNATVMPLDQLVSHAAGDKIPDRAAAVTFDDGYADVLFEAQPLLARAGVPATVFISTSPLKTRREFWWDELELVALENGDETRYQQLCASLRVVTNQVREGILQHLAESRGQVRQTRATHRALTEDEVAELSACANITIGSHTASHPSLAALTAEQQRREIVEAAQHLHAITSRPMKLMAYPFGGHEDVSAGTRRAARDAGVAIACTAIPGRVNRYTDPLRVPRFIVRNWGADEFRQRFNEWVDAA